VGFHRLTVPTYTGGLRGGDDYINNAVSGTPAPADGALGGGTYSGSYFFGQSDQVTGAALNRGVLALAANCDFLDDAVVALTVDVTGVLLARTVTGTGALVGADGTVVLDTATGGVPYNMALPDPASAAVKGRRINLIALSEDINTNAVTLTRFGSETISGVAADYVLDLPYGHWVLVSDGTDWHLLVAGHGRLARQALTGPTTTAVSASAELVTVNTSGGVVTATLPAPGGVNKNRYIRFKDIGGFLTTNKLTLARNGGTGNIEGVTADFDFEADNGKLTIWSDGTDWWFV